MHAVLAATGETGLIAVIREARAAAVAAAVAAGGRTVRMPLPGSDGPEPKLETYAPEGA